MGLYDYSELRGLIRARGKTQEEVAVAAHINPATLSLVLNGKRLLKQNQIDAIADYLEIDPIHFGKYFFARRVCVLQTTNKS